MKTIRPRLNKYIPIELEPKPIAFLTLPHREALYGGAAGGMKTETLLAAALQYCDIPGYSAILFRRSLAEHKKPNCLIPRAKKWLANYTYRGGPVTWNGSDNYFEFETFNLDGTVGEPARLSFGYCDKVDTELMHQGAEYQFVGWDELTQVKPSNYLYLFSRLRKNTCPIHKLKDVVNDETGETESVPNYVKGCMMCEQRSIIPVRVRGATNPGNRAHQYIRDRFNIQKNKQNGLFQGYNPDRPFIPAYVKDNPHIDQKSYKEGLMELDPVRGAQLMKGDWDASPDSLFRKEHKRIWKREPNRGNFILIGSNEYDLKDCHFFMSGDTASTERDINKKDDDEPDYTVCGLWGKTPDHYLFLVDALYGQWEIYDIADEITKFWRKWRKTLHPSGIVLERNGVGAGVISILKSRGIPIIDAWTSTDKITQAQQAIIKMRQGRILLPEWESWLKFVEDQLWVWQGLPDEPDDVIDMISRAVNSVAWGEFDESQAEKEDESDGASFMQRPVDTVEVSEFVMPNYFTDGFSGDFSESPYT